METSRTQVSIQTTDGRTVKMSAYAVKHMHFAPDSQARPEPLAGLLTGSAIHAADGLPVTALALKLDCPDLEPHWFAAIDAATD
jgi:hypothetical protein